MTPNGGPGGRQPTRQGIDTTIDADSDHAVGGMSGWLAAGRAAPGAPWEFNDAPRLGCTRPR